MTYKEILEREEDNWNTVYLYHEGMFLKAYNHSACLIHLFVHDFKVSKRFIKSVNQDVFSLGFPKDYSKKWLNARPFNQIGDKEFKYSVRKSSMVSMKKVRKDLPKFVWPEPGKRYCKVLSDGLLYCKRLKIT